MSAEEVLWTLWSGTRWPARLRAAATSGRPGCRRGPPRPRRGLRALRGGGQGGGAARPHQRRRASSRRCSAQQIPADTLADRGVRGEAVRLLTAHRSKGLEWRFVVVAAGAGGQLARPASPVDPAARRRAPAALDGTLPAAVGDPALLAEERRLFYVACTRARQRLLVTAVASPDDDGDQPSRFTGELGVEPRARPGPAARGRSRSTGWSPTSGGRPPTPTTPAAAARRRRTPAGAARPAAAHGDAAPRPGGRPGDAGGAPAPGRSSDAARCGRSTSRSRSAPAPSTRC